MPPSYAGEMRCRGAGTPSFTWIITDRLPLDIEVFVNVIGFTPMEAIVAATRWGAELMRMEDRIGTLEVGKLADLVVVDGGPLRDISILQDRARLSVMKNGQWVTCRFEDEGGLGGRRRGSLR